MSLLVLGLSHHNCPLDLLERISLDSAARRALGHELAGSEHVAEVVVVSTCNRTEVYTEAVTFHGAVSAVTEALGSVTGVERHDLTERLAVHYEDRAIAHAFRVAGGLDSMAVGESQIRAQLRASLHEAQEERVVGPALNGLFQQALRVGKRVHTETGLANVAGSLVGAGLAVAGAHVGPIEDTRVLVVGAGAMAALAAITARRAGAGRLTIANRTLARGQALAERAGGDAVRLSELPQALAAADIVIACVGSPGVVITEAMAAEALTHREGRPQAYVDLALPHDVSHAVADLPGAIRVGLEHLAETLHTDGVDPEVAAATDIVTGEVAAFLTARSAQVAAPTIAALRARATEVLDTELARLAGRTPDIDDATRREVEIAMGRLVDKLLHGPTLRVKELAASGRIEAYADALAELFALEPETVASVSVPPPFEPAADRDPAGGAR